MSSPVKLSQNNLDLIAARGISVPKYDRRVLKAGIVHFGVGNFHRAHQASYMDKLFNKGRCLDWAIVGAGILPSDAIIREKLAAQDYLTTIVEQDEASSEARVIGPMLDFLPVGHSQAIVDQLAHANVRIVSLTITEGGYFIDPATGQFNSAHPAIQGDAASPANPKTVFGLIVAALKRRKEAELAPFTVMSCDNIPHNGVVTRNAVLGLASIWDPKLAEWIGQNVAFPNTMVDRITPATGERELQICRKEFGIDDEWPVFCENFCQWVVEDKFSSGRPPLEEVGVQFVPDVSPFELMKIRILNGGHTLVAYPSALFGVHFVHDAIRNPIVREFVRKTILHEIIPLLPPVPGIDLAEYFENVQKRMENPKIGDTIRRLCFDGSNRQPKFIVPSIADALSRGTKFAGLALASALWCRYCLGQSEDGTSIEANDPNWNRLQERAKKAKENGMEWLEMTDIYGAVGKSNKFRCQFSDALSSILERGVEKTMNEFLAK